MDITGILDGFDDDMIDDILLGSNNNNDNGIISTSTAATAEATGATAATAATTVPSLSSSNKQGKKRKTKQPTKVAYHPVQSSSSTTPHDLIEIHNDVKKKRTQQGRSSPIKTTTSNMSCFKCLNPHCKSSTICFSNMRNCTRHMNTHVPCKKWFPEEVFCKTCNLGFASKYGLDTHKKGNPKCGMKLIMCLNPSCSMSRHVFPNEESRVKHMNDNSHCKCWFPTNDFCSQCNQGFISNRGLKIHQRQQNCQEYSFGNNNDDSLTLPIPFDRSHTLFGLSAYHKSHPTSMHPLDKEPNKVYQHLNPNIPTRAKSQALYFQSSAHNVNNSDPSNQESLLKSRENEINNTQQEEELLSVDKSSS